MKIRQIKKAWKFVQAQLRMLGFPLIASGEHASEPVFDGRSVNCGRLTERICGSAPGPGQSKTFYVLTPYSGDRSRRGTGKRPGWTLFPLGGNEVIRYQRVMIETGVARPLGPCPCGMIYEVERGSIAPCGNA